MVSFLRQCRRELRSIVNTSVRVTYAIRVLNKWPDYRTDVEVYKVSVEFAFLVVSTFRRCELRRCTSGMRCTHTWLSADGNCWSRKVIYCTIFCTIFYDIRKNGWLPARNPCMNCVLACVCADIFHILYPSVFFFVYRVKWYFRSLLVFERELYLIRCVTGFKMLMPTADRRKIYEKLFEDGVAIAKKDYNLKSHPEIEGVRNLYVIKALKVSTFGTPGFRWYLPSLQTLYV